MDVAAGEFPAVVEAGLGLGLGGEVGAVADVGVAGAGARVCGGCGGFLCKLIVPMFRRIDGEQGNSGIDMHRAGAAAGCRAGDGPVKRNHRKERKARKSGQPRGHNERVRQGLALQLAQTTLALDMFMCLSATIYDREQEGHNVGLNVWLEEPLFVSPPFLFGLSISLD